MAAKVGDTLVLRAKTKRLAPSQRQGVIEEILDAAQPRYVVRWGDGRTTVVAPLPGSFRIEPKAAARKRPAATSPSAGAKKGAPAAKPAARKPSSRKR